MFKLLMFMCNTCFSKHNQYSAGVAFEDGICSLLVCLENTLSNKLVQHLCCNK